MSHPQPYYPASCTTADETAEATPDGQTLVPFTGTLHVKLISGRFGPFPVGTLYTTVGSFTVRDEWLQDLDEGEHEGVFQVAELLLYSYRAYGEQRTCIRAVISSYTLFTAGAEEEAYLAHDAANDGFMPYTDDSDCYIPETDVSSSTQPETSSDGVGAACPGEASGGNRAAVPSLPEATAADDDMSVTLAAYEDENVRLLRAFLAGTEREGWCYGDPYKIDTTIGRAHIAKCRAALDALGYVLDTRRQLWLPADDGGVL